ncbi:MAG: protease inhibitor I42 family protein [Anaerolineaceae bacterium]|nr:protease inhibitor I42 family protein [Anaerolineaceae bacterium]
MVEEDIVRTVTLGQKFTIDLEAVSGGGYIWHVGQISNALELIGEEVLSISKEIGGNSIQRFTLSSHQTGNYLLVFELKRSWEKQAAKTAQFTIQVS